MLYNNSKKRNIMTKQEIYQKAIATVPTEIENCFRTNTKGYVYTVNIEEQSVTFELCEDDYDEIMEYEDAFGEEEWLEFHTAMGDDFAHAITVYLNK